ncbi:MAG: hypothetical protein RMJ98_07320 [Myxococcales bacterium]|nr:hypothetical protein [Polyangiaceae bacterium]MDW8249096.1 hypothetical protein [Myxococcales bacterium]
MGASRRHVLTLALAARLLSPEAALGAPEPSPPTSPHETESPVEEPDGPQGEAAWLWPTATPLGDSVSPGPLRIPGEQDGSLAERARLLDRVLTEAAQDLGLRIDVGGQRPAFPRAFRDGELVEEAQERNAWLISPRIERQGGDLLIRIVAVPPGSRVVLVREERMPAARLPVRAVVMLRDLVLHRSSSPSPSRHPRDESSEARPRLRTSGRSVLTATLAVFGGYAGYALHASSRSDDSRLLYPLMALGTGIGLGAATIVADEWDLSTGEAWFLAAGASWPSSSALLLSSGYNIQPDTHANAFALLAGLGGLGLSSAALARWQVGEGGALLAHSGSILGGGLGGLVEMTLRGSTQTTPLRGAGLGLAGGWIAGGLAGIFGNPSPGRVLRMDLGTGLGALGGAALGSPLLLDKNPTTTRERLWLGAVMGGAAVGAGVGAWLGRPGKKIHKAVRWFPAPGVVAADRGGEGEVRPVMGLTWSGSW